VLVEAMWGRCQVREQAHLDSAVIFAPCRQKRFAFAPRLSEIWMQEDSIMGSREGGWSRRRRCSRAATINELPAAFSPTTHPLSKPG